MRAFLVLLLAAVAHCRVAPLLTVTPSIPGQYIVVLEDGIDVNAFASSLSVGSIRRTISGILNAVALNVDINALEIVRRLPGVKFVEEDGLAHAMRAAPTWGIDRIDQRSLPLDGQININGDGTGAAVYIIDTGISYTHQEFGGRAQYLWDYQTKGDGSDCDGHGTHCAGTAAGKDYGVAANVDIFSCRVLNCAGSGSWSDIISALNAVVDHDRPNKVASMSIGGGVSESVNQAVNNAHAAGVVVVVAAGNENTDACSSSPASASDAITVGATTSSDERASYSNYGTCVDIFGPGSSVISAGHRKDDAYVTFSGTSMATPHVAGASAVLLGSNPGMTTAEVVSTLTSQATADVISDVKTGSPNLLLYLD